MTSAVAAVNLGATSGRVMLGFVSHNVLALRPVARFPNSPVIKPDGLHWDVSALYEHFRAGLAAAIREEPDLASIGVDSWAVDYGLLRGGELIAESFHYRDGRRTRGVAEVEREIPPAELYSRNGLQFLPFNTLYRLADDRMSGRRSNADSMLLVPDLIEYWLTGHQLAERTNASTTGLLRVADRQWDDELVARLGLPQSLFPELVDAGSAIGPLRAPVANEIGAPSGLGVTGVGSHDTASAVAGIPATERDFAYISCGTWSLVGVELEQPVLSEAGRVRYLRKVMGLWLLSEYIRAWEQAGETIELPLLLDQAAAVSGPAAIFDPDDQHFLAHGGMPDRIAAHCRDHGLLLGASLAEVVRSIQESLADAYTRTIRQLGYLTGKTIRVIHLVGGGSLNTLLCQLTSGRTGLPVIAGPVGATAIGNVLIQARAIGLVSGDLDTLRGLVARSAQQVTYSTRWSD
ncbi:MAG: rhamnulokinase [Candidatus Saccharibacteria bacterium]|nr:rhamnulokinase [Microbacteriaceae bacterium]